MTRLLAICLETVGCCVVIAGIVTEFIMKADIGFVIITSGSLIFATGSLIFAKFFRGGKLW